MKFSTLDASSTRMAVNWLRLMTVIILPLGVGLLLPESFSQTNIVMLFLLSVAFLSTRASRAETTVSVILSVLVFDLFFVHPVLSLRVSDVQYLFTLAVMLIVGLSINALTHEVREKAVIEAKNSFLSAISHDLRTPLTSIHGSGSTLLEKPKMDPKTRKMLLQSIVDESDRLNKLVNNILDIIKFDGTALVLKRELCPLSELIHSGIQQIESRPSKLRISICIEEPELVAVDEILVTQVFINLFENAAKYVPTPGTISITAQIKHNFMAIVVEDDGPGIPKEIRKKVFEKFYRGGDKNAGAGLGLSICKAIINAHGGIIKVGESELGGSKFEFTLPREL